MSASQAPRLHVAPRADKTYGDVAADFASRFGLTLDPWQRLVLDDWLAHRGGRWASRNCGLSVPRQNGKNAVLEVRELFGTVLLGEKFLHTAHEVKTAKKHFRRLQHFFGSQKNDPIAKYPELNALVAEVRKVNGEEAIILTNGGSIEMAARSKSSGRGFTVDVVVFDEAQQLDDDALEALAPTKSSGPLGNPQVIYTGTPPGPNAQGEVFTRQRASVLKKAVRARCWHEWSKVGRLGMGDGEVNLDDRANWFETNPALGSRRMPVEIAEDDREDLSDGGFARERLGMWADDNPDLARVIPADAWRDHIATELPAEGAPPAAIGLDRWHDGTTAIAGAWRQGDSTHVELLALDAVKDATGVVDWLAERAGRKIPVLIAADSPAASLAADLIARKVKVRLLAGPDFARSCQAFVDDAIDGPMTHGVVDTETGEILAQPQLSDALAGATKLAYGKAGAWVWDRRQPDNDISPLVAATLARFGTAASRRKSERSGTAYQRR